MKKMNESEARKYVESMGGNWDDRAEYVRYCWHCRKWVFVDDYGGDLEKCDDC